MTTVLIVEDVPEIADLYGRILSGYETVISSDVKQATNYLQDNRPDLTILDFHLPSVSGFSLLKYMRSHEDLKDVPIIGISSDDAVMYRAQSHGINAFLMKPIAISDLIKTTQELLAER